LTVVNNPDTTSLPLRVGAALLGTVEEWAPIALAFIPPLPLQQNNDLIDLDMSTTPKLWVANPTASTHVRQYAMYILVSDRRGERLGYLNSDITTSNAMIVAASPQVWIITAYQGQFYLSESIRTDAYASYTPNDGVALWSQPWQSENWPLAWQWSFTPFLISSEPLPEPVPMTDFQRLPSADVPHVVHNSAYLDYLQGIFSHNEQFVQPRHRPQHLSVPRKYVDRQQQAAWGNHNYYSNPEQILRARATDQQTPTVENDRELPWTVWCLLAILLSLIVYLGLRHSPPPSLIAASLPSDGQA
jgi:hypothetical protein